MTHVNELNERTRNQKQLQMTGDRLAALLIAVYKLPLEQRETVLEQYETNLRNIVAGRQAQDISDEKVYDCETCQDQRAIEVLGDGDNFEVDVVGYKPCPDCKWEDPIQD